LNSTVGHRGPRALLTASTVNVNTVKSDRSEDRKDHLAEVPKSGDLPALKLATFRLKTLDKKGRCKSRFEIDQFSIVPNL
jgi:hypothetical protein